MVHNAIAYHLLTDAQSVPEQRLQGNFPLSIYIKHNATWYGIWPVWVNCPSCVTSQLLEPPASLLVGCGEKLKIPWLGVITVQQQLKHHQHYSHPKPKHSTVLATRKKIDFGIPA